MSTAIRADVAVVGAGPAGMAAALAAADLGCRVVLVDASPAMGGQIYRPPASGAAMDGPRAGTGKMPRRLRRAASHQGIHHLPGTTVWQATAPGEGEEPSEFVLWLADAAGRAPAANAGPDLLRARALVIATGATELTVPFPGWDLPGVTTAGAAQALLKAHGVVTGHRVLVAGSGPLLLPAAAGLAAAGVRVLAVLEANAAVPTAARAAALVPFTEKMREAAGYAKLLARHRVPVLTGRAVTAGHGGERVQRATITRLTRDWHPVPGSAREVAVDAVHASFGFCPALELSRLLGCADVPQPGRPASAVWHDDDQGTSVPGVFAAGETTGVAGAEVAELEGYVAGASAATYAGRLDGQISEATHRRRTSRVRAGLVRARRFANLLDGLYPLRPGWLDWPQPDTVVCRCEEVPWSAIGSAIADGARDVRSVKSVTRCGMGYCQGRVCGPVLQQAVASATRRSVSEVGDLQSRPIMAPTALGVIAASPGSPASGGSASGGSASSGAPSGGPAADHSLGR
jgi:NADPH-dependent 2,4-dienoyl-CoA reductase/sulfur reductase-like enzyme